MNNKLTLVGANPNNFSKMAQAAYDELPDHKKEEIDLLVDTLIINLKKKKAKKTEEAYLEAVEKYGQDVEFHQNQTKLQFGRGQALELLYMMGTSLNDADQQRPIYIGDPPVESEAADG